MVGSVEPPQIFTTLCPMANTLSLRGLMASRRPLGLGQGVMLMFACPFGFDSRGFDWIPKLANRATFGVVIGWGHFLASNPLKSSPTPMRSKQDSALRGLNGITLLAGGSVMPMLVGLVLTPGGSTGFDASKQGHFRQGYFSRCHQQPRRRI